MEKFTQQLEIQISLKANMMHTADGWTEMTIIVVYISKINDVILSVQVNIVLILHMLANKSNKAHGLFFSINLLSLIEKENLLQVASISTL